MAARSMRVLWATAKPTSVDLGPSRSPAEFVTVKIVRPLSKPLEVGVLRTGRQFSMGKTLQSASASTE